jgi:energy-coupling factor transporter ATP-binding protein EcfA2
MQMVLQWCDQTGLALLVVTHDRELAHAVADRVLDMREGKPCE